MERLATGEVIGARARARARARVMWVYSRERETGRQGRTEKMKV